MSVDTNTPSGASNELYKKNEDVGRFTFGFIALEEKDPNRDNIDGDFSGSNTVVAPSDIGEVGNDTILLVGSVNINTVNFNDKEKYENTKKNIKARAEKSKEVLETKEGPSNDGIEK